jgi:outer membrane protein TolC
MRQRPDIALQEAAVEAAQAQLKQARSVFWPELSASYNRSWTGARQFPNDSNNWSAAATVSLPLFGGGPTAAYFSRSAARNSLASSRQSLHAARLEALEDLESSRAGFAGAVEQVEVQEALVLASRQRNAEADIRYANGLLGFDNWEIIVADLVSAERQNIRARFDAVVAEASWLKATGKMLGEP